MPSACGRTVGPHVMRNRETVWLLDGIPHLKAILQVQLESKVGWIQQLTLVLPIVREEKLAISEAEATKLSMLANKVL